MNASRLLISAITALSVVGAAGIAMAQSTTTTSPTPNVSATTPSGTTTTVSPGGVTSTTPMTSAETERMNRERLNQSTNDRSRNTGLSSQAYDTPSSNNTERRDMRAARNDRN